MRNDRDQRTEFSYWRMKKRNQRRAKARQSHARGGGEVSNYQDDGAEKSKGELLRGRWLRAESRNLLKKRVRQRKVRRRQCRRNAAGQFRVWREAGGVVNILREGGKIEAIAAVFGVDIPMIGMGIAPAFIGTGVGGVAFPLNVLLKTCIPLGAEAPGQTLCIAQARKNMGAKGNKEQQSTERGTDHNDS